MEGPEFTRYCTELVDAWRIRDNPIDKSDASAFRDMKRVFEKSIVTATEVAAGQVLSRELLTFKKPGTGIRADHLASVLGKRAARDLPKDHMLSDRDLA
jgi:sialic acid synthase SpsE